MSWNEVSDPTLEAPPHKIFVFGSNLAGRHGKGAALFAKQYRGAIYGQGFGEQGQSYAIPTKDANLRVLPVDIIANYVKLFIEDARVNTEIEYYVTPIGCGLAGYKYSEIAPFFKDVPENVELNEYFKKELNDASSNG